MNEDRKRILAMLGEGKITADEAERLLDAMGRTPGAEPSTTRPGSNGAPKYFRVVVDANDAKDGPAKVNVRIPMQLLRAGVRLSSMIPPRAREKVNAAMAEQGIDFDINQLKPENLEGLIDQLSDFAVDVESDDAKVRVFCE
jgi:hypothetical protein